MSALLEHQWLFASLVPRLLQEIHRRGYQCTLGEVERPRDWARVLWQRGKGTLTSLHCDRLAVDIHLFQNGEYLSDTADHKAFGDYWKSLDPLCRWGGDFSSRPDGNHYSVEYQGRK